MSADRSDGFLSYHEPNIIEILTLVSFFLFLSVSEWLADKTIGASLIGPIVVGLLFGFPIGNILAPAWQETFLALGYIGLILIIFEGGLTIRLDLLHQNLLLSLIAALIGVLTPIAVSFAFLYAGSHHAPLETFILGTSLCSTSLGTTLVLLTSASSSSNFSDNTNNHTAPNGTKPNHPPTGNTDFSQTRIGTVLVSAAVIDDVSLGWIIGRPVLASSLMALLTPAVARFVARPAFRRWFEPWMAGPTAAGGLDGEKVGLWKRKACVVELMLMVLILSAFLAIAAYAGASVLFGAFLAGGFVASLPATSERGPGERWFVEAFDRYTGGARGHVLQPLFFASIGFAVPFRELWVGEVVWKGVVYTLLMAFAKMIVGVVVPVQDLVSQLFRRKGWAADKDMPARPRGWAPAALLGAAMVARGEIGLLIIQIGLNETPFLTNKGFAIGVWAIVLNTVIGPVMVGILLKRVGPRIARDVRWGVQNRETSEVEQIGGSGTDGSMLELR
ncbi:hypothetical protein N656DRAFT_797992 [Canariomyces notabilis]|uniref:Cation/H+ exchanger transmembrane domain-containing protein n=1 Tax=Canariomyces notabilis TaxID=2074819 RepID=A0AAN6TE98_9PEZI|nr:hypothetical protein N656DRAFT_797992 [Canariomyces arenarius]